MTYKDGKLVILEPDIQMHVKETFNLFDRDAWKLEFDTIYSGKNVKYFTGYMVHPKGFNVSFHGACDHKVEEILIGKTSIYFGKEREDEENELKKIVEYHVQKNRLKLITGAVK